VNDSISSVTTEASPSAIAWNRSPFGISARRCRHGRYDGVKCGLSS
jgi:hypothetical protein